MYGRKRGYGLNHELGPANHNYKHGLSGKPRPRIYSSWANMIQRCCNPESNDFGNYGARGIKICQSLRESAVNLKLLIGDPPDGLTVNRIDNEGHYSCGRCQMCLENGWTKNLEWATAEKQSRNRRFAVELTYRGETHCITEWAEILGIKARTIRGRIARGWTGDCLLSTDLSTTPYKFK